MDSWKSKSQALFLFVKVTFFVAVLALILVILAYVDIHVWSRPASGEVILVPERRIVTIEGRQYIPITIVP